MVKSGFMFDEKIYDEPVLLEEMNYLLKNYFIADETEPTSLILGRLLHQYKIIGKQIHDSNLIATCIDKNIPNLLTNNPHHFQRFTAEPIKIVHLNSFVTE